MNLPVTPITIVVVEHGRHKGTMGYVHGDFEGRCLSPMTRMLVFFPDRDHPNECKQMLATRLREANDMEKEYQPWARGR